MRKTVLIVVDCAKRELFGNLLLAKYLSSLGIRPVLCNIFLFHYYYLRYMPDGIVFPNVGQNLEKFARTSSIFILPTESGSGQDEQIRITYAGTKEYHVYPECVDKFFCWGSTMHKILLDTSRWQGQQLSLTGSPHTDHWLLPDISQGDLAMRVGVTTTFRVISNGTSPAKMNYFQWLDMTERGGGDGNYYLPPEHAESWLFFEASLARVIIQLTREVALRGKEELEIRPHPFELESRYDYLKRISPGKIFINKKGTISDWLKNKSILFTLISTSALDAIVRGVPVVSLKRLIDPDALRKIPAHFRYSYDDLLWQLDDLSQVGKYIDSAANKTLSPCRDMARFNDFLARYFFFPRKISAAESIATEINKVLANRPKWDSFYIIGDPDRNAAGARDYVHKLISNKYTRKIIQLVLVFPILNIIEFTRYIYGLFPGRFDISGSFLSWRRKELKRSGDTVNKLRRKLGAR